MNIKKVIDKIPPKVRGRLRNKFTSALYSYLLLRSDSKRLELKSLSVEVTDLCNLSCSYCVRSEGVGDNAGDLEFDLFKTIVDQAAEVPSISSILIGGYGEPLLYPHLIEAIEYIKSKRDGSLYTGFYTNGTLLDERMAERLVKSGIDHVVISLNFATREKYFSAKGVDLYDKVVGNIINFLNLADSSNSKIRIIVQFMDFSHVNPETKDDAKLFRAFWKTRLGKNGDIVVKTFVGWLSILQWKGRSHDKQMAKAREYPCYPLASSSFIIARNGNVLPCCGAVLPFPNCELSLGNVKEKHLADMCLTGMIHELRRINLTGEIYNINPCNKCEEYMAIPISPWIKNPFYPIVGPKWL